MSFLLILMMAIGCGDDVAGTPDAGSTPDARTVADTGTTADGDIGNPPDAGDCPNVDAGLVVLPSCARNTVVDTTWLAGAVGEPGIQIVDVRSSTAFEAGHVPGAVWLDATSLRATVDGVPGQVAAAADAQAVFRAAGLSKESAIAVYADATDTSAARVVWTLEYYEHPLTVLLDGGFGAWSASGGATETGAVTPTPSTYTIDGPVDTVRVDADFVLANLDDPAVTILDVRTPGEYAAGHVPGAINVDWTLTVEGGAFKDEAQLRALYESADLTNTVVTYCQTGSRAAVGYVVMRLLGVQDVRLYDGSWAEWGSRPELPKEM